MNAEELRQNAENLAKKLRTMNIKIGHSFNYKSLKIKTKYVCSDDNNISFCYNAGLEKVV